MDIRDKETEINRGRGVLTSSDRKFLAGQTDMEAESERQARQRIRDRIKNGLRDFWFIQHGLPEKDRELIADDIWADAGPLWQGYIDMLGFFYRLETENNYDLEGDLFNAIKEAESIMQQDRAAKISVDVEFSVERKIVNEHSDLNEKFENNEPMTPEEAHTLIVESDYFDHLPKDGRWELFREFLSGELDVECIVEEDDDWTPYA